MIITISPEVADYLLADIREVNGVPLHHANQHSRLFHQQLEEFAAQDATGVDLCDHLTVTRDEAMIVGHRYYDVLIFTFARDGYQPKVIMIRASDVQDRHPLTHDLLFRGHRLIDEVFRPALAGPWMEANV
ncbi:MAG: hypothetical protein H0X24_11635 [Ktedonobacterales bacterium]|nr:hypothetical protein [Ktedonobacterales bacterium]